MYMPVLRSQEAPRHVFKNISEKKAKTTFLTKNVASKKIPISDRSDETETTHIRTAQNTNAYQNIVNTTTSALVKRALKALYLKNPTNIYSVAHE